jgi:hypothetical protein
MSRVFRLVASFLAVLLLSACGARQASRPVAAPGDGAYIQAQIAALKQMPVPDGVSPAVWRNLSGALCEMLQARLDSGKTALRAPGSSLSQARLTLDDVNHTLSWLYTNQGDYDQNSEVNAGDLVPLAKNFLKTSGGGPFAEGLLERVVDGDNNGEINAADITPIAQNLGRSLLSYNVYTSSDAADLPASNTAPNGPGAQLLGTLGQADGVGDSHLVRLSYAFPSGAIGATSLFWVRPNDAAGGAGEDGTPSSSAGPGAVQPTQTISGKVLTDAGNPLEAVTVGLTGTTVLQTATAADGTYSFDNVPAGACTLTAARPDIEFTPDTRQLVVGTDPGTGQDFTATFNASYAPYGFHLDLGSGPVEVAHFAKGTSIDCFVEPGTGVPGWQASYDDDIKQAVMHWNSVGVPWGLFRIRLTSNKDDAEMYFHWVTSLGGQTVGRANIQVSSPPPQIDLPMDIQMATGTVDGPVNDAVVRMTTVHELGHALGLWEHSDQNTDIMFPSVGGFELPSKRDEWTMYTLYNTTATFSSGGRGPASVGPPGERRIYRRSMD